MTDETDILVRPELHICIKEDRKHCGMTCPFLDRAGTLWSCSLFRCDLYVGLDYVERNGACIHAEVR